jgi:predicted small lipoprotein YifL
MVSANQECPEVTSSCGLQRLRIAVFAALVGALAVAGCGRKGGLDPPPTSVADPTAVAQPGPGGPDVAPEGNAPMPTSAGRRKRTPLDWLLD